MIQNDKTMIEFQLRKCESELVVVKNEFKLKQRLLIEKIKIKYQNKISKLQDKISKIDNELADEKAEHFKTQNGLKHLRSHFLTECLPIQQKPVKISDDKIKTF